MTLWLARHAQPLIATGVCYGQLDMAADTTATAQCAAALASVLPAAISVISSPLQRCVQLGQTLRTMRPELDYQLDPRLMEMHFGAWEGQPWADIAPHELQAWTDDFNGYRAGSSGESVAQLMARVAEALDARDPAHNTIWITHAGVIRAAMLIAGGQRHLESACLWPIDAPAFGQWVTLAL